MPVKRLRLAELAAALSIVTDLAAGLDEGHGIRSAILAMRLAERLELSDDDRATVFWVSLLRLAGWTARSVETATVLGVQRPAVLAVNGVHRPGLVANLRRIGRRPELPEADRRIAAQQEAAAAAHRLSAAEVAQVVAGRFGMTARTVTAIGRLFAPADGPELDIAVRVWRVAHVAEPAQAAGGRSAVRDELSRFATVLDPDVSRTAARELPAAGGDLAELLSLEPEPVRLIDQAGVDVVLPVFGMIADFSAPYLHGHSDRVAQLAADAAVAAGKPPHDVSLLRRAGWVHDVGRVGVATAIWTGPPPVTAPDLAAARSHPQLTRQVLERTPGLAGLAAVAAAHHERSDGSGYPLGPAGAGLPPLAALLAAADAYVSAGEPRPHRPARPPIEQALVVLGLARDGQLPHEAVDAVIAAVNGRVLR